MKPIWKLLIADVKQFVRERAALFWTFAFPVFFILIFGAIFSGENDVTFPIGVVLEDDSTAAQSLSTVLQQVPAFEFHMGGRDTELEALEKGDRRAVLVVSPGFGKAVSQGKAGSIDIYYDPTQTNSVQVVLPILHRVLDQYERILGEIPSLIEVNEKTLHTHDVRSIDYLTPGILAMAIMQLGIFAAVD